MTYELAKKLKDAGFPAKWDSAFVFRMTSSLPTLEELIEACGDNFMLTNETGEWEAWSGSKSDTVRMGEAGAEYECKGLTPAEAVANLWLKLNEKNSNNNS